MAKKPNAPVESAKPAVDPQQQYLMDQFGGLMDQVGDGFGGPLQEELIRRLECKLEVNTDTIQLIQLLLILLKGIPNTHININILKSFIKGKPHISHFPLVNERHIPPKIMKKQKVPIIKR